MKRYKLIAPLTAAVLLASNTSYAHEFHRDDLGRVDEIGCLNLKSPRDHKTTFLYAGNTNVPLDIRTDNFSQGLVERIRFDANGNIIFTIENSSDERTTYVCDVSSKCISASAPDTTVKKLKEKYVIFSQACFGIDESLKKLRERFLCGN